MRDEAELEDYGNLGGEPDFPRHWDRPEDLTQCDGLAEGCDEDADHSMAQIDLGAVPPDRGYGQMDGSAHGVAPLGALDYDEEAEFDPNSNYVPQDFATDVEEQYHGYEDEVLGPEDAPRNCIEPLNAGEVYEYN